MKSTLTFLSMVALYAVHHPFALAQDTPAEAELEHELPAYEYVEYVSLPKPIRGPMPKARRELAGMKLKLRFTVTQEGKVEDIRLDRPLATYSDVKRMTFANQTLEAVAKWRFQPARNADDHPVAVQVIMPVKIVEYGKLYRALASIDFDEAEASLKVSSIR